MDFCRSSAEIDSNVGPVALPEVGRQPEQPLLHRLERHGVHALDLERELPGDLAEQAPQLDRLDRLATRLAQQADQRLA